MKRQLDPIAGPWSMPFNSDPLGAGGATCIRSISDEETNLIVLPCLHHTLKELDREVGPSLGLHPVLFPGREEL